MSKRERAEPTDLKRDNWTNEDVIKLLKRCQHLYSVDGKKHNNDNGIEDAIEMFHDFQRDPTDPTEYAAMAYSPALDQVFHIGTMPPK
jgi:hypothetical protein